MAYKKPTSVTRTSTYGRYSGAVYYTVKGTTNYYVYAMNPNTYVYWKKGQITSSSGLSISIGGDDSTSDSYTTAIILSSTDLGTSCTIGNEYSSYLYYVTVPLYVFRAYRGDSTLQTYDNCSQSGGNFVNILGRSDYDNILGITTSSTSTSPTINATKLASLWKNAGSTVNGKTYYAIYSTDASSFTGYYYRGSSSKKSVSVTINAKYLYGKGTTSGGGVILGSMTTTCLSNSSYTLQGWATSSSTTTVSYYNAIDAFGAGYTTIYGVYYNTKSTSTNTVYYYRGSSAKQSVTETATTAAGYYYGKGSKSGGATSYSYGTITTSCLGNSSYSLVGWTGDSTSTTADYTDAEDAFNSYNTIYGIYKKAGSSSSGTSYYYRGTSTQNSVTKTTTTADAYLYGTGQSSGGTSTVSYGTPTTTHASDSSYVFQGWATSSSSSTVASTTASTAWGSSNTIYGVYKKAGSSSNSTVYYYRGNSTKNSATKTTTVADKLCYGTGTTSGGGTSTSYGTITTSCAVSGWTFLGFTSSSSTQSSTSSATSLFDAGNTTIYGTYSKTDTMTYYPENGESSGTVSATNYRYGTGSVTDNSPTEPTLAYDGYTFLGWAATADGTADTWDNQYDSGTYTVYAIWERDGNVYLGVNGEWILLQTYYGVNSEWVPIQVKYGAGSTWN